jgi:hypothetical protein
MQKEIVISKGKAFITLDKLSTQEDIFVGVQWSKGKEKGFLVKDEKGFYIINTGGKVSDWSKSRSLTLAGYMELYQKEIFYSFDDAKELFEWLVSQ